MQTFTDEEEALALAAHEHYGLATSVYAADIGRHGVDHPLGRSADLMIPAGGYHQAGIGKDLGHQAVEVNLRVKSVLVDFAEVH